MHLKIIFYLVNKSIKLIYLPGGMPTIYDPNPVFTLVVALGR
jgi:hypothetical protein